MSVWAEAFFGSGTVFFILGSMCMGFYIGNRGRDG